ncbi:MAG TPA: ABC transporter ATP-binding protein [Anaerolineae bacterium]|nr:ABC transporter ATP-binding protein [Anaerolineae bacterium]
MSYLELTSIHKSFSGFTAVTDFNLSVKPGEFISFLGPSGCGKTTTLRMIAGFEMPTSGAITLAGNDVTYTPANKRNIGMVFQSYALFPNMTVMDNIGYGLRVAGKSKAEIKQRVEEMLRLIHLEDFAKRYPSQLSGGQQQRVALARALAFQPKVLLLDEPLSALDALIRVELRNEIRRIQQQLNITTIYVTHDQEEALSVSDRIVVMNQGKIEQSGTPTEIYNFPRTRFVASFVGTINQLDCTIVNAERGELSYHGAPIRVNLPLRDPNGAQVKLMLRPEVLRPGLNGGYNNLTGRVESVNFLGSTARVLLNLGDTTITMDVFNERQLELPQVGHTHSVNFLPNACWVVEEDKA